MARSTVSIQTRDGKPQASIFQPEVGKGPWPAVLVYHDGRGVRPAFFDLAQRIAQGGYFVLLPDLFYRGGPYEAPDGQKFGADPEFRKQWQQKYSSTASKKNVRSDTEAFLSFLAGNQDVSSLAIGTTGYCLGGGLSLSAAGHFPDRVIAAASYHGGNLATDDAESPHLLAPKIKARVYVAGAVEDNSFSDEQKQRLIEALDQAGVKNTVETYEGAKHGWVPSDSAAFNAAAAERHYQTLLALFDSTLKNAPRKS